MGSLYSAAANRPPTNYETIPLSHSRTIPSHFSFRRCQPRHVCYPSGKASLNERSCRTYEIDGGYRPARLVPVPEHSEAEIIAANVEKIGAEILSLAQDICPKSDKWESVHTILVPVGWCMQGDLGGDWRTGQPRSRVACDRKNDASDVIGGVGLQRGNDSVTLLLPSSLISYLLVLGA